MREMWCFKGGIGREMARGVDTEKDKSSCLACMLKKTDT